MTQPLTGVGGVQPGVAPASARQTNEQKAAEGFERLLLGQLTKALVDSAMPAGETASAATAAYRQVIPDTLTEALMSGGGICLAKQLEEGMR